MNKQSYLIFIILSILILIITGCEKKAPPESKIELNTTKQKYSYAIGFQIGNGLKKDKADVDVDIIKKGIVDVLSGSETMITVEEMQTAFLETQKAQLESAKKAGQDFLAANKSKEGVVTLESGIQYKVIKEGDGAKPTAEDSVVAHYKGTLIDGTEFDSSYKRGQPATFGVGQVIKGWQEVLPLMATGSKWQVFIPSDLAYGERGAGGSIGPNETLVFDIELLEVKPKEAK